MAFKADVKESIHEEAEAVKDYSTLKKSAPKKSKPTIDEILNDEKDHHKRLTIVLKGLKQSYGKVD